MKKIIIISFLLIFSTTIAFSQSGWFWQNPLPQGNDLNSIEITPDGTIFTSGNAGTIMRSLNGGDNWIFNNNILHYNGWFNKISFIDNNSGWAIGENWSMYYTSNNGLSWNMRYTNNSIILYDIYIKSNDTAWACGTTSTIVKTINNWQTYTTQLFNQNQSYHLQSIAFFDMNTGYCVGSTNGGTFGGVLYSTTNSGFIWNSEQSPVSSSLESINCLNSGVIIIATGQGQILRSTNYGKYWNVTQLNSNIQFKELFFHNLQTGWVVGTSGNIYKTTNSGINWFQQVSNISKNLFSVKFKDLNTGYITGKEGLILKTTNGGSNWLNKTNYILNNENNYFQVVKFLDINTGYCFGWNGIVARTTDGGNIWINQKSYTNSHLMRASFIDNNNIWAAGYNGTLIKTTNGGNNWSVSPFSNTSRITGIHFVDQNTGFISTQSMERFFKTTNSGLNWLPSITIPQIQIANNIYFINSQTGFILSDNGIIYKTIDGSISWATYSSPLTRNLYDIYFLNPSTGWICGDGGIILKTTNTGLNWVLQNQSGQPLLKIFFTDELNGWTVGLYGYMRKTTNGGQTWDYLLSGTDKWLQDVFFINQTTGWIVSANLIMKTTNGGYVVSIVKNEGILPQSFFLHQNYPNPFNPVTKIKFDIPFSRVVTEGRGVSTKLIIYDLLGSEVTTLVNEQLKPGSYSVDWDGTGFASGVYFYKLVVGDNTNNGVEFVETKRMVLVK